MSDWSDGCFDRETITALRDASCPGARAEAFNIPGWTVVNFTDIFYCQYVTLNMTEVNFVWEADPDDVYTVGFSEWFSSFSGRAPMLSVYYA